MPTYKIQYILSTNFVATCIGTLLSFIALAKQPDDSVFNKRGGVYNSPISISVVLENADVYYTIDGNKPNKYSTKYTKPIQINAPTVIRAKVYYDGIVQQEIVESYIVEERKLTLPVISIAVNPDDFFSSARGIYAKGCCADTVPPYKGGNFWKGWERPINIELYETDGTLAFNQGAGARIFGGFSKGLPMKSLAIIAREKYGAKRFKYQLFPNKDIKKYKAFVLRNSGGDFNNTHFRDGLLTDLVESLDIDIQAFRPAIVYINGKYWGIHNIREKLNEHYLKSNHGANPDSVDLLKHRSDIQEGNKKEYNKLLSFLKKNSFKSNEKIQALNTLMDIDNYINYNLTEIYVNNGDAGGNIRYWREQKQGARWRWILFDLDHSFGIGGKHAYKTNTLYKMTRASNEIWPNPAWSTFIIRKLLENDSIKNLYINRFADHLNTVFSEANVLYKIDSIYSIVEEEIPHHMQRWKSSNMDKWNNMVQRISDFAANRPHHVREHIIDKFDLVDSILVTLDSFDNAMGKVRINSLMHKSQFEGWYFSGCPIIIEAIPKKGYEFIQWGGIDYTNHTLTIDPENGLKFYPIFKKKALSEHAGIVVINEISTKQDSTNRTGDWIELVNNSSEQVDVSGWVITAKGKKEFIFPEASFIAPNSYWVICKRLESFQGLFQLEDSLLCSTSTYFGFSSKKEKIRLYDNEIRIVDTLYYTIKEDFKSLKGKENKSLEKINPKFKSTIQSWRVSENSSPGKKNEQFQNPPEAINAGNWITIGGFILGIIAIGGIVFLLIRKRK